MIVMGVDTSDDIGVIGVSQETKLLGEILIDMKKTHLKKLLPSINYLLESIQLTIQDIDLFTVVQGPGSWSGTRIGTTAIKTLAHSLNKPLVGVCSLDVLAYNLRFTNFAVYAIVDGSREKVYVARYNCSKSNPERITDYSIFNVKDFLTNIELPAILVGNGVIKYGQRILPNIQNLLIAPRFLHQMRGAFIIEAGLNKFKELGPDDTLSLGPFYLQKIDDEKGCDSNRLNLSDDVSC